MEWTSYHNAWFRNAGGCAVNETNRSSIGRCESSWMMLEDEDSIEMSVIDGISYYYELSIVLNEVMA